MNRRIFNRDTLQIAAASGFTVLLLYITDIGCPFRTLLGICCAGCGMTRALMQVLHGHIREAFHFHPLWITLPVIAVLLLTRTRRGPRVNHILQWCFLLLFISVYLYRITHGSAVVYFRPEDGILFRILKRFRP